MKKFLRDRKTLAVHENPVCAFASISCDSPMSVRGPGCVRTRAFTAGQARQLAGAACLTRGLLPSTRQRPECVSPVSCCRPGRAAPFRYLRSRAFSSGSASLPSTTLSCRRDVRQSGGVRASYPGSDRAALAQPQGRLRAPNVRSAALCLLCICSSVRRPDRQWSNSAAVSCHPLRWCSDRAAVHQRDKGRVCGDIDEILLAEASFGVEARGHRLRRRSPEDGSGRQRDGQNDTAREGCRVERNKGLSVVSGVTSFGVYHRC
jgi:hypothetical protein